MWSSNQFSAGGGGGGGMSMNMDNFNYGPNMIQSNDDRVWTNSTAMGGQHGMMGGNQIGGMNSQTTQQMGFYSNSGVMNSHQENPSFNSAMQGQSPVMGGGTMTGGAYHEGGNMRFGPTHQQFPANQMSVGYTNEMPGMKLAGAQPSRPRMLQQQAVMDMNSPGLGSVGGNSSSGMYQQRQQMQTMMAQGQQQIPQNVNYMAGGDHMANVRGVGSPNPSGGGSSGNMMRVSPTGGVLPHQQSPVFSSGGNNMNQLQNNTNTTHMSVMNSMKLQQQQQQQQLATRANAMYMNNQFGGTGMRPTSGQLSGPGGQMLSNAGGGGGPRRGGVIMENCDNQQQTMIGYGNSPRNMAMANMSRDGSGTPMMQNANMQQGGMRVNNMSMAPESAGIMCSPNVPSTNMGSINNQMQYQPINPGYPQQRQRLNGGGTGMTMGPASGMMRGNSSQQAPMSGMHNAMQRQQALQRMGIATSGNPNMAGLVQQGGYQGISSNTINGMSRQQGAVDSLGTQGMGMQGMGMQGIGMQGVDMSGSQNTSGVMSRNMPGIMPNGGFLGKRGRMEEIRERRMAQGGQPILKFLGSTAPTLNSVGAAPPPGMRVARPSSSQAYPASNATRQSPIAQSSSDQQRGAQIMQVRESVQHEQGWEPTGEISSFDPHGSGTEPQQLLSTSEMHCRETVGHDENEVILVSDGENEDKFTRRHNQSDLADAVKPAPASTPPAAVGSRSPLHGGDKQDKNGASGGSSEYVSPTQQEAPASVNDSTVASDVNAGVDQAVLDGSGIEVPQSDKMASEGAVDIENTANASAPDLTEGDERGPQHSPSTQASAMANEISASPKAANEIMEAGSVGGSTANVDTLTALAVAGGFRKSPKFAPGSSANMIATGSVSDVQPLDVPVNRVSGDSDLQYQPQSTAMQSHQTATPRQREMQYVGGLSSGMMSTGSPTLPRASILPADGMDHAIMEAGAAVHSEMLTSNTTFGATGGVINDGGSNGLGETSWQVE